MNLQEILSFTSAFKPFSSEETGFRDSNGVIWPSMAHLFQANKTNSLVLRSFIASLKDVPELEEVGRSIRLKKGWDRQQAYLEVWREAYNSQSQYVQILYVEIEHKIDDLLDLMANETSDEVVAFAKFIDEVRTNLNNSND